MPSDLQVDNIKDGSATKTLATLSSSAVTLSTDVTVPASIGGSMVLLEKFTASDISSKTFDLNPFPTYNHYKFIVNGIEIDLDSYNFRGWLWVDGTGWLTSGQYRTAGRKTYYNGSSSGDSATDTNESFVFVNAVGNDATYGINGEIDVFHPRNSSVSTACTYLLNSYASDNYVYSTFGSSFRLNAEDNDYIKMNFGSAVMESGTITLYGIKDA